MASTHIDRLYPSATDVYGLYCAASQAGNPSFKLPSSSGLGFSAAAAAAYSYSGFGTSLSRGAQEITDYGSTPSPSASPGSEQAEATKAHSIARILSRQEAAEGMNAAGKSARPYNIYYVPRVT
jgi:hypothetical protein